jgi:Protein ENHANCED DISEASE RESISTANCE 2, C-terminal
MSTNTTGFVSRHARSSFARRNSLQVGSLHGEPRARSAERQTPKHSDFDDIKLKLELDEGQQQASSSSPKYATATGKKNDQSFGEDTDDGYDDDDLNTQQARRRRSLTYPGRRHDNLRQSLISDVSMAQVTMGHRRANSDPFDDAGLEEIMEDEKEKQGESDVGVDETASVRPLPTMQRFPYAATQNRNTWSEPPCDIFKIRGSNYLKDKKKVVAQKYLLSPRGSDLFLTDTPEDVDMSK